MSDGTLMTPAATDPAAPAEGAAAAPASSPAAAPAAASPAPADPAQPTGAPEDAASKDGTEGAKPEGAEGEEGKTEVEGAPEEYADFTMPEGVGLEPETTGEFKTLAKELNLSQANAQRVVELGLKLVTKAGEQQIAAARAVAETWAEQSKADPEIGGAKLAATLETAIKARDEFASPALVTLLKDTGLGNHPEVIRLFAKVGAAISEDKVVTGGAPAQSTDRASKFYPSMTQQ